MSSSRRGTTLGPHDLFLLDQWGRQLEEAFGDTPYLVGSVERGKLTWRDVDVRMVNPLSVEPDSLALRTINVAISLWGRQVTGLPIDFQFQGLLEFNSHGSQRRNPLGGRSELRWQL